MSKRLKEAYAERAYWTAWAEILGWRLVGWSGTSSASFVNVDGVYVRLEPTHVAALEAIAGERAPKKP